jgi:hypothetical protein
MPPFRKTAIVQFTLPGDATGERERQIESKPLTCEREYGVLLTIEGRVSPAHFFQSPRNDEQWREFVKRLRDCNVNRDENGYRGAVFIRSLGADLYRKLTLLSPRLRDFLNEAGTPRRLVIQTRRPELHLLPWAALGDEEGKLLAAGDLSIVQAWDDFAEAAVFFPGRLNLVTQLRPDTPRNTAKALASLPSDWGRNPSRPADVLNIEAHGDAVTNEIGECGPWAVAEKFGDVKLALLWSCYSAAANSWGESPALCLHRLGAAMVLSFQAELHNEDARSISAALYSDVFGAAATRDPESALLRIRCDKYEREFAYAAWASMTVYLRAPLDLSALPLNGPRVPALGWTDAPSDPPGEDAWAAVAAAVSSIQPGADKALPGPVIPFTKIPRSVFASWNGVVIRLDGDANPVSDACLQELGLARSDAPTSHSADRLIWFFEKIARFGSPLLVWTNCSPCHWEFLTAIAAPAALSFLLLYRPETPSSVPELVDANRLAEARQAGSEAPAGLSADALDEYWSAAYFAFARGEDPGEPCRQAISRITGTAEKLLQSGNYVSRFQELPDAPGQLLSDLEKFQYEEDFYRQALGEAIRQENQRDIGRARLELAYLLQRQGENDAAGLAYRAAADALQRATQRDSRWHSALGRVLRDHADLLAASPGRLAEASELLRRATAIHSFHGRQLQVAYCRATAARIDLAVGKFQDAVLSAMDAANAFELCAAWRGWSGAVETLLDALAELGDTARMKATASLAIDKLRSSNLPSKQQERLANAFALKKAEALFADGDFAAARAELQSVTGLGSPKLNAEADRLRKFLAL